MMQSSNNDLDKKNDTAHKKKEILVLFDIDYTLFNTKIYKESNRQTFITYEEVINVLQELKNVAKLGIFSEGEDEFQKTKLLKTGIDTHFEKNYIHIVKEKNTNLEEILTRYKNYQLFFVDDKLTILHSAKLFMPNIFTIWIKRGKYAISQGPIPNFTPDATFANLRDIIPIIVRHD